MMIRNTIIILLVGLGILITASTDGASVLLKSEVKVTEGKVTLSDIATISDCSKGLKGILEDVVVAEAPLHGRKTTVTLDDVRRKLRSSGVNMRDLKLSGASVVRVSGNSAKTAHTGRQGHLAMKVRNAILSVAAVELDRKQDALSVKHLYFTVFGVPDEAVISVTSDDAVKLSGVVKFKATATVGKKTVATFDVTAEVRGVLRVVAASRNLAIGTTIREADIEFRNIESDAVTDTVFEMTSDIVGEKLAKRVQKGRVITGGMIARPILVNRGDVCTLIVRGRGFHIRTEAKAMKKAGLGEEVMMQNIKTRRRFRAVVVGRRRVEVQGFAKEK